MRFDYSCKLPPIEIICVKCQNLSSGKIRKLSVFSSKLAKELIKLERENLAVDDVLTLVLLNPDRSSFANSVDPGQLASEEAN